MNMWLIFIGLMLLGFIVQATLNSRFDKYSKIPIGNGMTGADIAIKILRDNGIYDVRVTCIKGKLTDHYNPTDKTVNLSESVYHTSSIAAAAVAAHECFHAVQHATGYSFLKLRSALVPVVSFSSRWVMWILFIGIILMTVFENFPYVFYIGIALFALLTLFSFVTLPVEINASSRAIKWLTDSGIANFETRPMAVDALRWAAYTYVISAISSLVTLLYYIRIGRR